MREEKKAWISSEASWLMKSLKRDQDLFPEKHHDIDIMIPTANMVDFHPVPCCHPMKAAPYHQITTALRCAHVTYGTKTTCCARDFPSTVFTSSKLTVQPTSSVPAVSRYSSGIEVRKKKTSSARPSERMKPKPFCSL